MMMTIGDDDDDGDGDVVKMMMMERPYTRAKGLLTTDTRQAKEPAPTNLSAGAG